MIKSIIKRINWNINKLKKMKGNNDNFEYVELLPANSTKRTKKFKKDYNDIFSDHQRESSDSHQNNTKLINQNINVNYTLNNESQSFHNLNNNFQIFTNYYQNIYLLNTINCLTNQYKKIKQNISDFHYFREKGIQYLSSPANINHYLINYINKNSNYNNSFPLYKISQTSGNSNNLAHKNFQISFGGGTNNQTKEKIKKPEKKVKNDNTNENNEIKISESNEINIKDIRMGKETRTVVRLSPIPPNYSSFDVSKLLDIYLNIERGCNKRIYKALFVPLCKTIGKNLGYCFIMLVKPKYVIKFYNTFNGTTFNKKKCKKPCKVVWANLQGDDFLNVSDDPLRAPIIFKDTVID
jgi:hypothetical protein